MVENNMIKSLLSFKIAEKSSTVPGQLGLHPAAPAPRMILQASPSAHAPIMQTGTMPTPLCDLALRPHKKPNNG